MKYIPVSLLKQFNILNLIYMAAQRQVGETALNDNSSRSHQIIRLVSDSSTIIFCNSEDHPIFLSLIIYGNNFLFYSFWCILQTIQSTLRENADCVKSFVATLVIDVSHLSTFEWIN